MKRAPNCINLHTSTRRRVRTPDGATVYVCRECESNRPNPAAVALGRLGGKATSKAKAAASRANGAKGGRPTKADRLAVSRHVIARKTIPAKGVPR